ncbi:hypothetical protein K6N13_01140 [Rhizobium sp. 8Z]|nr:hypothetical protein [Rhizobium redzepovicii]MBY4617280.1 hypothetical protein [Rhizobium redzepovicii]TBY44696.1 hypothetical protein E0H54_24575 [Rhizobium leguminosarum bv. viciae]
MPKIWNFHSIFSASRQARRSFTFARFKLKTSATNAMAGVTHAMGTVTYATAGHRCN